MRYCRGPGYVLPGHVLQQPEPRDKSKEAMAAPAQSGDDCDGHVLDYAEMLADGRGRVSVDIDPALPAARDLASSQGCRQDKGGHALRPGYQRTTCRAASWPTAQTSDRVILCVLISNIISKIPNTQRFCRYYRTLSCYPHRIVFLT